MCEKKMQLKTNGEYALHDTIQYTSWIF